MPAQDPKTPPNDKDPKPTDNPNTKLPPEGPEPPIASTSQIKEVSSKDLADHKAKQAPLAGPANFSGDPQPFELEHRDPKVEDFNEDDFETYEPIPEGSSERSEILGKVLFQFDRDTTLVAGVVERYSDGTLDLTTITDTQGLFKTNIGMPPSEKLYQNVRPGSRHEAGTFFELPEELADRGVGEKIDIIPIPKKQPLREPIGV